MKKREYRIIKRLTDLATALILLLLLLPLMFVVIIVLYVANDGKPFFFQKRPGKKGEIFTLIKFRSMTDERDEQGTLLPDVRRTTKVGNFIRSYSIDELPQLLNVIKGDMSFIGPRPLLIKYLPLYNEQQARRHEVKPGITGWAQVNGRNDTTWEERFKYDVFYVDHQSFQLDLQILIKTIEKVLRREGVNASGRSTMKAFTGNKN